MSNTFLKKHTSKNIKNYILSNFLFLSKKLNITNLIKLYFFYNTYNFYIALCILFNFWITNISFLINKNKIVISTTHLDFFINFSTFFYPYLLNLKVIWYKTYHLLYLTFFINKFFLNPIFIFYNQKYNINIKKTFNIFKIALFLKKNFFFF